MTIGRIWRSAVDPARATDYERFAAEVSLPMFEQQPGFAGVVMMRSGSECLVLTLWNDRAAVDALAGSATYLETVRRIEAQGFLVGGSTLALADAHLVAVR
jgi:heme-degrading monooxygenase HmoA